MRRFRWVALAGLVMVGGAVAAWPWVATVDAQTPARAGVRTDLMGGPSGVVKTVLRGKELGVDGMMVQLIDKTTNIRTTVYTDPTGRFEFPKLANGEYVLRVPRPLEFKRYQQDAVKIAGATRLPDIVLERITEGLFLPPTKDILSQLTGAEWLANVQGTAQEKRLFTNMCTNSCHGGDRPFMATFDKEGWYRIVDRMSNYSLRILTNYSGRAELTPNAKIVADFLARVRGPESAYPPIEPFARPKGAAARAVVTEYEIPWAMAAIHDITADAQGRIFFNLNRSPLIGRLDPATGHVTAFRVPKGPINKAVPHTEQPGIHPGLHWIQADNKNGYVWFSDTWSESVGRLDPRTGEVKLAITGLHGNIALSTDGLSIWRTDQNKIKKYDTRTIFNAESAEPVQTWDLKLVNNTYGNFVSKDGRYFGGGSGSWIVWLDTQTNEVREIPIVTGGARGRGQFDNEGNIWSGAQNLTMYNPKTGALVAYTPPTPYYHSYSANVDKNGDVWSGQQQGGRVGRFNPKTGTWIEYQLPSTWSFDYNSYLDNSTSPPTFWYGDQHGYVVRVQPLE